MFNWLVLKIGRSLGALFLCFFIAGLLRNKNPVAYCILILFNTMSVQEAKALLIQEGYQADNLWHRYDVFNIEEQIVQRDGVPRSLTNDEADAILEKVMRNEHLFETIFDLIRIEVQEAIQKKQTQTI